MQKTVDLIIYSKQKIQTITNYLSSESTKIVIIENSLFSQNNKYIHVSYTQHGIGPSLSFYHTQYWIHDLAYDCHVLNHLSAFIAQFLPHGKSVWNTWVSGVHIVMQEFLMKFTKRFTYQWAYLELVTILPSSTNVSVRK